MPLPDITTAADRRAPLRFVIRLAVIAVLALFIALLVYGVATKSPDTRIDEELAKARAVTPPAFTLPVLQRGTLGPALERRVTLAAADGRVGIRELRGTPVVLNFWASWCPPCREEAPLLQRTWRARQGTGVLFVGLDMQDLTEDAHGFLREFGTSYLNVRDRGNDVARDWGVTGLPETFFLSAEGKVVAHVIGAVSARQLSEGITAARSGRPLGALSGGDRRPTQ